MSAQDQESPANRAASVLGSPHEGALLLTGAPGIGKSHLLRAIAAASPIPTVTVHGTPTEAGLPLSGLGAVLASLDARAADFAGRFTLRSSDQLAVPAAAADILALLRGLRLPATGVLVDDLDEMDAASRGLLGFMAGRLAGTGVRLIATAAWVGGRDPLAAVPRARLSPLRSDRALEIVLAAGGPELDEGTARILVAHSAGNVATLLARLKQLRNAQRGARKALRFPLPVRRAGRRIARHALERVDEVGLRVAQALSVAPLAHPAALVDAGVATRDQLDDLVRAALVVEADPYVRLHSPLVRAAVFGSLAAARRRDEHALLAAASAAHAPVLARWHAAALEPDGDHARTLLRDALTLLDAGFLGATVEFADEALGRPRDATASADVLELSRRLLRRGDWALGERYLTLLGSGELPARDRSTIAFTRLHAELERTGRVTHSALASAVDLHGQADPSVAVRLLATTALWGCLRGDFRAAHELLELTSPFLAAVEPEAARLLGAVAGLVDAGGGHGGIARAAPAVAAPDPAGASAPELVAAGRSASLHEDYDTAARLYAAVVEQHRDDPGWRDVALLLLADNAARAGRVEECLVAVGRVQDLALGPHVQPMRVVLDAWAAIATGRADEAAATLRTWIAGAHGTEGLIAAAVHTMLGWLELQGGDPEAAVRELQHADLLAGDADPGVVRHHPLLIDALAAAGRPDAARAAFDRFESAVRRFPSRWAAVAVAGARAVVAPGDTTGQLFDRALGTLAPGDPPLERARLLLRKGLRLRESGAAEAETVMLQARAAFEAIGATAWYPSEEPERPRPTSSVFDLLSEPERDVARLVLLGLQNKEIAATLFVSLRTVELRLTHIYRKTGTRSRSQLVAALA